jgi:hypothetical protein
VENAEIRISPLLVLLTVITLGGITWVSLINPAKPGLKEVERARLIEPLLQECFINGLAITAAIEKNTKESYEILDEKEEFDAFSKTAYKVVTRGKKLHEPETSCEIVIRRGKMLEFIKTGYFKFKFSEKNRAAWTVYLDELRKSGILVPGNVNKMIAFSDCAAAKKLYDSLQSFFAISGSYQYNFNY